MRKLIVGVMGPGASATTAQKQNAYQLGQLIAQQSWVLLTGGRNVGVMDAASLGAKAANGLTIGILPTDNTNAISEAVDIAIITDIGNARNNINVLPVKKKELIGLWFGGRSGSFSSWLRF